MMEKILKTESKNGRHFENQLFEYNNLTLHSQDDSCILDALKMHLVFGLGISAPAWSAADMCVCNVSRWSWNARTKDKVHF